MNLLFTAPYFLAAAANAGSPDYVKNWVHGALTAIHGRPGDYFVVVIFLLMLLFIWKKLYRAAAGCLVLICGTVIVRIVISIMFGI